MELINNVTRLKTQLGRIYKKFITFFSSSFLLPFARLLYTSVCVFFCVDVFCVCVCVCVNVWVFEFVCVT